MSATSHHVYSCVHSHAHPPCTVALILTALPNSLSNCIGVSLRHRPRLMWQLINEAHKENSDLSLMEPACHLPTHSPCNLHAGRKMQAHGSSQHQWGAAVSGWEGVELRQKAMWNKEAGTRKTGLVLAVSAEVPGAGKDRQRSRQLTEGFSFQPVGSPPQFLFLPPTSLLIQVERGKTEKTAQSPGAFLSMG